MTRFCWDQVDVLTCLEVEPTIDEEAASLHYEVRRNGWRIALTIFAGERDLHIILQGEGHAEPLTDFWMTSIGEIRYSRRDEVEELLFLSSREKDDRPNFPFGLVLRVSPHVQLFFGYASGDGLSVRHS